MSTAPRFPAEQAFRHLSDLAGRAGAGTVSDLPPHDPFGLAAFFRRHTDEPFEAPLELPRGAGGVNLGGRVPGRTAGPPVTVAAAYRRLPAPEAVARGAAPPWGANADGSGIALVLALAEALAATPPLHPVDLVLLAASAAAEPGDCPGAEAYADRLVTPPAGVILIGQVAGEGLTLDVDIRSLANPLAGALLRDLFLLGRALGRRPFSGGAETAFPGLHVPFLERDLPAVCLSDSKHLLAATPEDTLARCDAASLAAVGDVVLRYLCGERVV